MSGSTVGAATLRSSNGTSLSCRREEEEENLERTVVASLAFEKAEDLGKEEDLGKTVTPMKFFFEAGAKRKSNTRPNLILIWQKQAE